jgi:hypothetical protein
MKPHGGYKRYCRCCKPPGGDPHFTRTAAKAAWSREAANDVETALQPAELRLILADAGLCPCDGCLAERDVD